MTPQEAGQKFLTDILPRIPEDQRAVLQQIAEAAPELAVALGEGALRQADYSRNLDAVNTRAAELRTWYDQHQPLLDFGAKARAAGFNPEGTTTPPPSGTPPTLPNDVVRTADLDRREVDAAAFFAYLNGLSLSHYKEFGEVLDTQALMADPRIKQGARLQDVYQAVHGPKFAEKQRLATEAEITKRVEEGVAARMKDVRIGGDPRFPNGPAPTGSPLDALAPVKGTGPDVSELVDEYFALVGKSA